MAITVSPSNSISCTLDKKTPDDFDNFLPWAAMQMCDFDVVVTRDIQVQYSSLKGKERKMKKHNQNDPTEQNLRTETIQEITPSETSKTQMSKNDNTVYIQTSYNDANDLVRLKFTRNKKIPRLMFKLINLAIPYHTTLSSIIINQGLSAEAIYEISKYYPSNLITELILDNCFVPEANFHLLLNNDVLKHFSLSRCFITDSVVQTIASKLTSSFPAAKSLSILNLSINRITDVGVKYLAEMLRTNRQLSYLNLAHNRITDEGANSILDILRKFVLSEEEIYDTKKKFMYFLKRKSELIVQTVQDLRSSDYDKKYKRKVTRTISIKLKPDKDFGESTLDADYIGKAEAIVRGVLGKFHDAFSKEETITEKEAVHCLGNTALRYLNFAYNNLTYISAKKINEVIEYQKVSGRKPGLLNIRIEGNFMPKSCNEYNNIDDLLSTGLLKRKSTAEPVVKGRGGGSSVK